MINLCKLIFYDFIESNEIFSNFAIKNSVLYAKNQSISQQIALINKNNLGKEINREKNDINKEQIILLIIKIKSEEWLWYYWQKYQ